MKTPKYIALPTEEMKDIIKSLWFTVNHAEQNENGIHPDSVREDVSRLYWLVKTTLQFPDAQSSLQGDALIKESN